MTDTIEFRIALLKRNLTFEQLAEAIGIATQTLSYKVNNHRPFRIPEVKKIQDVLRLTPEETQQIFFADSVACKATNDEEAT